MNDRSLRVWLPAIRAGSGADVFVLRLAEGLCDAGHEPVVQWFPHRYELMPWRLSAVLAPREIDVVHAASWQGFAFKRSGIPLVVTEHQYVDHPAFAPHRSLSQALYHRGFISPCTRRSYRQADALVAVSYHVADAMQKDGHSPMVIHNWVDCRKLAPLEPARSGRSKPFKLLFVGNPSRWKGEDVLSDLASMLGTDFEIHCLGGLRKGFGDTARLPDNMRLLPRVELEQMSRLYQSMDAVLVPTRYEAFGYVALEAMACGLPIVGFNSTGTAELALHGESALLAAVDDVAQLANYVRQLAADHQLCKRLGKAGRQRALTFFDEPMAMTAYLALYRRLIAVNSGHAQV